MAEEFNEGWTSAIDYQLKRNGAAFDASGMTVELVVRDRGGIIVALAGVTDWLDEDLATVRYEPARGDLTTARSPLRVHWRVTDTTGKVALYPKGPPEEWLVYPA